ncbi:MAG: fimbrillin family protein [Muribaculaceae bacterium]|nr:fimbrillin family protein [Muribaculaceae bacterium]
MKKSLFFAAIAATIMASCANEESVEMARPSGNAIGFESFVGKATRADMTNSSLESFYIYGGKEATEFDAVQVTKAGSDWTYSPERFWAEGETYKFAAVAPSVDGVSYNYDDNKLTIANYAAGEEDLIVATTDAITAQESGNPAVALNFKHALAKVQFTFTNSVSGATVKIENARLSGVNIQGTLEASYATGTSLAWSNVGTTGSYTYSFDFAGGETASAVQYLVPQTLTDDAQFSFKVTITGATDEPVVQTLSAQLKKDNATAWETGKQYNYNLKITGSAVGQESIQFEVNDFTWESDFESTDPSVKDDPNAGKVVETKQFECLADTWVRGDGDNDNWKNGEKDTSVEINKNNFDALYGFKYSVPEGMEVQSAKIHLITCRWKTNATINIYSFATDFAEDTDWATVKDEVNSITSGPALMENYTPVAPYDKDISDTKIPEDSKNLAAWTNNIDVTEYMKTVSNKERVNFLLTLGDTQAQVKFFTKDNNGVDAFKNDDNTTFAAHFTKEELMPYLEVTFVEKGE